jgi:Quinohemoprotein amine dehydrogenase, alpha subunit domain III
MRHREKPQSQRAAAAFVMLLFCLPRSGLCAEPATPQNAPDVAPDATPTIAQVDPNHAIIGTTLEIKVTGKNFSPGAYISFSTPGVRVASTHRISAEEIQAEIAVNPHAQAEGITLYVSNPASAVAQTAFALTDAGTTPGPAAPTAPAAPQTTTTEEKSDPTVTSVDPPSVSPGAQAMIKIKGKNFAQGVKASFSNSGIQVKSTTFTNPQEISVDIHVATDAATGQGSVFVTNPDYSQAEAAFAVSGGTATPTVTDHTTTGTTTAQTSEHKYDVYNLGEAVSILQSSGKTKGVLSVTSGKLKYEENGQALFTAEASDVKEIGMNVMFGVNTGTFHVILSSGKTYNFIPGSLSLQEGQKIVDALRSALK